MEQMMDSQSAARIAQAPPARDQGGSRRKAPPRRPPGWELRHCRGRGPRVDGARKVDIAAPGNFDVFSIVSKDTFRPQGAYEWFGGTSAAGPHVAGAVAVLLQSAPT